MGASNSREEDEALLLAAPKCTVVGKRRMLDTSARKCFVCQQSFSMCNKKHYCRRCGQIVCDTCTTMRHYIHRTGHGFRVCERCNIISIIQILPQKLWHLIVSYCGNVAHHRTIQVCRKMQLAVPLPFQWGETWEHFFTDGQFISKGANGSVFKTTMRNDPKRTPVAVKVIQKNTIFSLRKWHHIHREIDAMRACKHPHIIELVTVCQSPESVYIVLQFAQGGDLFDWLVSRKHPSEVEVKPIANQLLTTLQHMHDICGCVHRDIKPENILLEKKVKGSETPHIRLADFGFARVFPQLARGPGHLAVGPNRLSSAFEVSVAATPCGTLGFAAPEIIQAYSSRKEAIRQEEEELTKKGTPLKRAEGNSTSPVGSPITPVEMMKKMDIFAAGVTICILLTGCEPFPCHSSKAHLDAVNEGASFEGRQWAHVSQEAKDLLRKMLHPAASKRPSALDCLQSRWMTTGARSHMMPRKVEDPAPSTRLLATVNKADDDDELSMSFQKSIRSLRKNDGMMFVTDSRGAVQRRARKDVVEDTLRDEPPVLPPGPQFATMKERPIPVVMHTPNATPRKTDSGVDDEAAGLDADME